MKSSLCQTHTHLFQISKAVTALNTSIWQGMTCRNLFTLTYQHKGETNHLVVYATGLKEICLDTQMSLALGQEFQSQICIPAWRALSLPYMAIFCKQRVKGHHSPAALEAQPCTESLSPPSLDTSAGTWCIYLALLYLLCGFSQLDYN